MKLQYKFLVAIIYAIALFLDRLDLTIVNITLATIAKTFNIAITATDWINLSFLIALAISIPISGWLGNRFGLKNMYILSMILFGVGSILCAFAPNLNWLIALRFIHGLGGGMLIPIGMTIMYRVFDKSEYANIASLTFLPALVAPAIAPFLGGILLDTWGWQFVFLFSGPICLFLAITTIFLLRDKNKEKNKHPLDWPGFIFFSTLLIDVFYTLSLLGKKGNELIIILGIVLSFFLTYAFIKAEQRSKYPLIDLNYFKNNMFVKANFIQLTFQACHFGAIFLISMYLQIGVGMSASLAGLIMGMQAIGAIVVNRYSVELFNKKGAKLPITIGLTGVAILTPSILLIPHITLLSFALILFFLRGIFSGLCGVPIQTLSVIGFDSDEIATANIIFNAFRQVSISFGVALSSSLIAIGMNIAKLDGTTHVPAPHIFTVFGPGFLVLPVIAMIGVAIVQKVRTPVGLSH